MYLRQLINYKFICIEKGIMKSALVLFLPLPFGTNIFSHRNRNKQITYHVQQKQKVNGNLWSIYICKWCFWWHLSMAQIGMDMFSTIFFTIAFLWSEASSNDQWKWKTNTLVAETAKTKLTDFAICTALYYDE